MQENEILFVQGEDEKRIRAYKRLGKYGFKEYWQEEKFVGFADYNPKYWTWTDE